MFCVTGLEAAPSCSVASRPSRGTLMLHNKAIVSIRLRPGPVLLLLNQSEYK